MIFQSTRPVWGATVGVLVIVPNAQQISIHAPRVGRDSAVGQLRDRQQYFNPRAPCGARPRGTKFKVGDIKFQSTRPVWGATKEPNQGHET